ncbi:hypothetical protein BLNAU_21266 [Blattamonas nauphoetae]|uniref:Uncharacterized protein n=1 Tax=Blattamonas nauphoetae TaxID=2049346 RepID=A0ABQ9WWY3_9EUKA|nr:hypothetical protein BLNAU_21266 [Blattamonas nauphoetae]
MTLSGRETVESDVAAQKMTGLNQRHMAVGMERVQVLELQIGNCWTERISASNDYESVEPSLRLSLNFTTDQNTLSTLRGSYFIRISAPSKVDDLKGFGSKDWNDTSIELSGIGRCVLSCCPAAGRDERTQPTSPCDGSGDKGGNAP